jgi:RND family efflux transporter MFP subunit
MKKTLIRIAAIVAVVLLAAWLLAPHLRDKVLVEKAVKGTAFNAVTGTVKVYANIDIKIKTEVNGRVAKVQHPAGDVVKKNDVVMTLDSQDLNNQIRERVVQLTAAKAQLKLPIPQEQDRLSLLDDLARVRKQVEFGGASKSELERRERDMVKLDTDIKNQKINRQLQVDLFQSSVTSLMYNLDRMSIKAPMDGTLIEQYAWEGDLLGGGNQVFRIVSPGRWLELTLSEEDCAGIDKGQKANVRLASYPDKTFTGTVSGLSQFADADRKTRTVFLTVDATDDVMLPGLTGEAVLIKAEHKDTVLIPRRALIGNRVYVVDGGRIRIRKVQPGFTGLDVVEIVSGVATGDEVVIEGQNSLREGDRVATYTEE